ncbi:dbp9 [Symbiodinium pilosum]|uniref:RNA helicase n=1 Tax=Symbiodinium pilosum TaxID=2952 RepID=A0A812XNB8_SYMPI|nr:dbp9 [Symbiodinium pilosum]
METLAMGALNSMYTVGVGVACAAFVTTELRRRFDLTNVNLKMQSVSILCHSLPESCALGTTLLVALAMRLFSNPDRNVSSNPAEIQVWEQIKQEWPVLMGADTLLAVQAMLRLLVWAVVVLRTRCAVTSPLSGSSSMLFLSAAGARSLLAVQTAAYGLDGPLGGSFAVFCEATSAAWLTAMCSKVGAVSVHSGAACAMALWAASRHYLNLSGSEPGGDFSHDKLFILAHCLEFFAAMAFLAQSVRCVVGVSESQGRTLGPRRSPWDGFVYLILAIQQALPAYYFLTAFAPSQSLVGQGRPFCVLIMANLLQLAFLLCALAFYLAGLLGTDSSVQAEGDDDSAQGLVQSRGIPVALEGKDLLCRARTGSGKTLCYAIPLVQRLLQEVEAKGAATPLSGLILVPTKELIAQVHRVVTSLLTFCFDVLTVDILLSGEKYSKAELPVMLVTTPSSLLALVKQRQARGAMRALSETLKVLILDEADLMFSYGYEDDVKALCALMPAKYQAMLVSATLSEEVEQLKGLMLHKPVVLKLEEPRVTGKLSQFYFICHKTDKYLIIYTLLKLQLIQGKTLIFVQSVEAAYRLKILLERFSINSAVLNSELPHASRQNIIDSFNEGAVELLIATDEGLGGNEEEDMAEEEVDEEEEEEEEEGEEDEEVDGKEDLKTPKSDKAAAEAPTARRSALRNKAPPAHEAESAKDAKGAEEGEEEADEEDEEVDPASSAQSSKPAKQLRFNLPPQKRGRKAKDEQYSLTRGVDLQGVSTVLNADVPTSVRDYVHRVGRCARGGASGTALTICTHEEQPMLSKIIQAQSRTGTGLQALPMQISDAERFRYRVEDMARGLTKKAISKYRARELQMEALHSEKLKAYFEEHPDDKRALQRMQRALRERKSVRQHLKSIPSYLVPEAFQKTTPVQKAVREANASAGKPTSAVRRKRLMKAKQQDPLRSFDVPGVEKRRDRFTRDRMIAKDRRMDPTTTNVEALPPLSRHKLWKLQHGKRLRKPTDVLGERRRLTPGERKRRKKFG